VQEAAEFKNCSSVFLITLSQYFLLSLGVYVHVKPKYSSSLGVAACATTLLRDALRIVPPDCYLKVILLSLLIVSVLYTMSYANFYPVSTNGGT
jgi:hypothetical protein